MRRWGRMVCHWSCRLLFLSYLLMAIILLRRTSDREILQAHEDLAFKNLLKKHAEISQLFNNYRMRESAMNEKERDTFLKKIGDGIERAGLLIQQISRANNFLLAVPEYAVLGNGSFHLELDQSQVQQKCSKEEPSLEYENLLHRVRMGVVEMWYFISNEIRNVQKMQFLSPAFATNLARILEEGTEHKRSLIKDVAALRDVDGHASWRIKEAADLSDHVQRQIMVLQNPSDCMKAPKLLCNINWEEGFTFDLHVATYCLIVAHATGRTMMMRNSNDWRFKPENWNQVFKPLSESCLSQLGSNWTPRSDEDVVIIGYSTLQEVYPFIPQYLAPRLIRLYDHPFAWWVGQFVKYFTRPQPNTAKMLRQAAKKMDFKRPIVGMHIRRTDKITHGEGFYHSLEEYMIHVEEYYRQLALTHTVTVKRVYLATDDPAVYKEIKTKYPEYKVVGNLYAAQTAFDKRVRRTEKAQNGIIMDIFFLTHSDFIVCTLSSNLCRTTYELMHTSTPDATSRYRSLDDIYYYIGGFNPQKSISQLAVLPHQASTPEQIDLKLGDTIAVAGNHFDGFSKGTNMRTKKTGLYPSFKVQNNPEVGDLPDPA